MTPVILHALVVQLLAQGQEPPVAPPDAEPAVPVTDWLDRIPIPPEYRAWVVGGAIILLILLVLRKLWAGIGRAIRRRRPPNIHPNLQKYNVDHAEIDRKRRELAVGILATSTGARLAGFRIARQVEAVFVEGFRSPEDAIVALKAAAVEKGANALLNVQTDRTAAGRCTASADAVVVTPIVPKGPPSPPPTPK